MCSEYQVGRRICIDWIEAVYGGFDFRDGSLGDGLVF